MAPTTAGENTKDVTDLCQDRRELLWKGAILGGESVEITTGNI